MEHVTETTSPCFFLFSATRPWKIDKYTRGSCWIPVPSAGLADPESSVLGPEEVGREESGKPEQTRPHGLGRGGHACGGQGAPREKEGSGTGLPAELLGGFFSRSLAAGCGAER